MSRKFKTWLYVLVWMIYIAGLTLFGEYIISRPCEVWIQFASSFVLIISSFYLIKSTYRFIIESKYFNTNQDDNN